jgi:hypothetical protein
MNLIFLNSVIFNSFTQAVEVNDIKLKNIFYDFFA